MNKKLELRLKAELEQANLSISAKKYLKKSLFNSFFLTLFICFILFLLFDSFNLNPLFVFFLFFLIFYFCFMFFINYPKAIIIKKTKGIDREILYAIRFLLIEINSGVPLFNALKEVSTNFKTIGVEFKEIVNKVNLGTDLISAINQKVKVTSSKNFKRFLIQISNSIQIGTNLESSLDNLIKRITQEQKIEIQQYGKKLNPLSMFYLLMGIIFPSIGLVLIITASVFVGFNLSFSFFLVILIFSFVVQIFFLTIIKSSRPNVEL